MKRGAFLKKVDDGLDPVFMNKHFSIMILLLRVTEYYGHELTDYLEPFNLSTGTYGKDFDKIKEALDKLANKINPADLNNEKKLFLAHDFERLTKIIDAFMAED